MIKTLLKPLSFLPALMLMYMIYSFSAQPGDVSSALSYKVSYKIVQTADYLFDGGHEDWQISQWAEKINFITRKLAHMTEYFALAVAVSFPLYVYGLHGFLLMLTAGIICVGFACGDEYHQSFVSGRSPAVKDVCIDSFGVFWGIILVRIIGWTGRKTIFRPRKKKVFREPAWEEAPAKPKKKWFGRKRDYRPQDGYDPQADYRPQNGYEPQGNYRSQRGYQNQQAPYDYGPGNQYDPRYARNPRNGYETRNEASYENGYDSGRDSYTGNRDYSPERDYEPEDGYPGPENDDSYSSPDSYPPENGYEPQDSYPPENGYEPQDSYPPEGNYDPSYPPEDNYYDPEGSYAPGNDYDPQYGYGPETPGKKKKKEKDWIFDDFV